MKIFLSVLCLFFCACGNREQTIDPIILPYLETVLSWAKEPLDVSIASVTMGDDVGNIAARCFRPKSAVYFPYSREIVVNRNIWPDLTEDQRLETVAHELGHCQWNAEHSPTGLMIAKGFQGDPQRLVGVFLSMIVR